MSTLASQQQALLKALFAWPADDAIESIATYAIDPRARGLKAYQANAHSLAERALQAAYPVLSELLGSESFADLSRALWHAHPPKRGDIACWGSDLAAFVASSDQLQEVPYLADVARAEWALHLCASAPDQVTDLSTIGLLTTHEPDMLRFELVPGCFVVRSAWPIASILTAHLEATPSLQEAGALVRAGVAQDAVVWRSGLRPKVREALVGEGEYLQALLAGASFGQALDTAPQLDFGQWLPMAAQSGLVLSVQAVGA